jgi:cytochrome b pre-mRNA-processing protein 3
MLWPFNHFRKPPAPRRGTIEAIYGMIVAQAREPAFYRAFAVPDTVDGRFDMVLLHVWLVLRRLRRLRDDAGLAQALFDHFCSDMDANLREMGVGDLTVPKRMQKFGEAFYGRSAAYDAALDAGAEPLAQALCKNILDGRGIAHAPALAAYVTRAAAALAGLDDKTVVDAAWQFPSPAPFAATTEAEPAP